MDPNKKSIDTLILLGWVYIAKMKRFLQNIIKNRLAIDSAIVFAGTMGANIGSYLYHLLIGRMLGTVKYGEISSLFSLLYIFSVPILVAQTILIKYVSAIKAKGSPGQSKTLFLKSSKMLWILSICLVPFVLLLSPLINNFLHLTDKNSFLLLYIVIAFTLLAIPATSLTQGYQRFIWFGLFSAAVVMVKLVVSIPLAPWGVTGMLCAAIFSAVFIYILYFYPIRDILKVQALPSKINKKDAISYSLPTLMALLGITSMYSTDIILVRHYFTSVEAGLYAALAILGKIIFFASSAIAQVAFPVLSEQTELKNISFRLIRTAILAVVGISVILVGMYFLFPTLIVQLLFGNEYEGAGLYLGSFGVFLALFSIGNVISVICLAIGKVKIYIIPLVLAGAQILLITLYHDSLWSVLYINILLSAVFALFSYYYLFYWKNEKI